MKKALGMMAIGMGMGAGEKDLVNGNARFLVDGLTDSGYPFAAIDQIHSKQQDCLLTLGKGNAGGIEIVEEIIGNTGLGLTVAAQRHILIRHNILPVVADHQLGILLLLLAASTGTQTEDQYHNQ